jgi:hypothetical protein
MVCDAGTDVLFGYKIAVDDSVLSITFKRHLCRRHLLSPVVTLHHALYPCLVDELQDHCACVRCVRSLETFTCIQQSDKHLHINTVHLLYISEES